MKCPRCGYIKKMIINDFVYHGMGCNRCSDGMSYPEKVMLSVLEQLNLEYKTQLSKSVFEWCDKYKYDFYIPSINCIIETHGIQHYKNVNWSVSLDKNNNLEKIKETDRIKEQLAKDEGVKHYIVIDCRESNIKYIKNNILNSDLTKLFDLFAIDWLKCHEYACNSLVKVACDLWNNGIKDTKDISDKLKISRGCIIRYLKQGKILNWCNYNPNEETIKKNTILVNKMRKKVICITTKKVFDSITKGAREYSTNNSTISKCCMNKKKSAGKHPETGEPLKWMYYEDYLP